MLRYCYLLILLIPLSATAQIIVKRETKCYFDTSDGYEVVNKDSGFALINEDLLTAVSGVEKLHYLKTHIQKGNSWRKVKSKNTYATDLVSNFYGNDQLIITSLPKSGNYIQEWSKQCDYSLFFGSIRFPKEIDTVAITVVLPKEQSLEINWSDTVQSNVDINFSSSFTEKEHIYTFSRTGTGSNNVEIRVFITSDSINTNQQFANKYLNLIEEPINEDLPQNAWLDSLGYAEIPEKEKVALVLQRVQKDIGYISITNGLQGLCPRPASYTEFQKQGDCKAMSLLIHQYLKTLHIKSNLAISASLSHRFKMDFPSVSSGNHMVCVYKDENDSLIILDATDDQSSYPFTSRHTQSTQIFVLNKDSSFFHYVHSNKFPEVTSTTIHINAKTREGSFAQELNGLDQWLYREIPSQTSDKKILSYFLPKHKLNIQKVSIQKSITPTISTNFFIPRSNILNLSNQTIIDLSFLPIPDAKEGLTENYNFHPFNQNFTVTIQLDEPFHLNQKIQTEKSNTLYYYRFKCSQKSDTELEIYYELKINTTSFSESQIAQLNQLNSIIKNDFHSTISLQ